MVTHPIRRILVPVDFSASSGDAPRFAHSLARALGASIEVLHVMDRSDTLLDRVATRPSGGDPAAAQALPRDFVAAVESGSVPMSERLAEGEPHDRIISLARDEGSPRPVLTVRGE